MVIQYRAEHLNISPLANEDTSDVRTPVGPVVSVRQRAGRAGMPAGGDLNLSPACGRSGSLLSGVERKTSTLFRVLANANNAGDAHDVDDFTQVVVAGFQHRFNQRFGKVVRRDVLAALTQEQEGAVVHHKQVRKGRLGRAVGDRASA